MDFQFQPLGDHAVLIELGEEISPKIQQKVRTISTFFDSGHFDWVMEYVPGYTTVAVFYNPLKINAGKLPYAAVCEQLEPLLKGLTVEQAQEARVVEIPVCYGGEFGPDLDDVAKRNGLTPDEVIHIHASGEYLVYMIGFAPGFPFIGGMSEKIAAPRRKDPRLKIPAGSVGIAGKQTGVYPIETPGGWQLIGKTPLKLFTPHNSSPSLLRAGDQVRFKPITRQEYAGWEGNRA
jgi:inhibitor of KinA